MTLEVAAAVAITGARARVAQPIQAGTSGGAGLSSRTTVARADPTMIGSLAREGRAGDAHAAVRARVAVVHPGHAVKVIDHSGVEHLESGRIGRSGFAARTRAIWLGT